MTDYHVEIPDDLAAGLLIAARALGARTDQSASVPQLLAELISELDTTTHLLVEGIEPAGDGDWQDAANSFLSLMANTAKGTFSSDNVTVTDANDCFVRVVQTRIWATQVMLNAVGDATLLDAADRALDVAAVVLTHYLGGGDDAGVPPLTERAALLRDLADDLDVQAAGSAAATVA